MADDIKSHSKFSQRSDGAAKRQVLGEKLACLMWTSEVSPDASCAPSTQLLQRRAWP